MKFAPQPKHPFDVAAIRVLVNKVNALLKINIIDASGAPAGEAKYADGNTTLQINAGGPVVCKLYDPAAASTPGKFYKVRSTDTAAVTGVTVGSDTVKSTPGKYLCLKATPATPVLPEQIPALPDLISTDPAAAGKYWEWFSPAVACIDGATVEV